ncbi:hypothetical protein C0993_007004, partial [Termitomyces sp. T159_Od127]
MTNPDVSGMLRFLTDELQNAEDAGDRGGAKINTLGRNTAYLIRSSLDNRTRTFGLGRRKPSEESHQSLVLQSIRCENFAKSHEVNPDLLTEWTVIHLMSLPTFSLGSNTHEDQLSIFYANNGTVMSAETAQTLAWIGPSVTPLTNLNSGFRVYEVDSA